MILNQLGKCLGHYFNVSVIKIWNNIISSQSHVSNGVQQGGCLSPTLISVYLNELIETLRKHNIGCRYGSEYMGVLCYADDLVYFVLLSLESRKC